MFTASPKPPLARTHSDETASEVKDTCNILAENELAHSPQDDTPTRLDINADDSHDSQEIRVDTRKLLRSVSSTSTSTQSDLDLEFPLASVDEVWTSHRPHFEARDNAIRNARFNYWAEQDIHDGFDFETFSSLTDDPYIQEVVMTVERDIDSGLQTDVEHSHDKPLFFDNLDHRMAELEFDEVGFGENLTLPHMAHDERDTLLKAIDEKIASIEGFTAEQCQQVKEIVVSNIHAFGTKDSPARMSKLEPIECVLKHDSEIITQPRWLGREQMEFLRTRLQSMLKRGLIRPTYNPLYGSQAFLVPKTGPDKYRMVVDMRKLNQQTR